MPSALRKGLSAIYGAGKGVTAEATRRSSLSWISLIVTFFCNVGLCIDHIWLEVRPAFGSMYHLFQPALCDHWDALRLISARSRFISYSLRRSSSSCSVVSRSPSPFCSIVSQHWYVNRGLQVARGRLHCHVSAKSDPCPLNPLLFGLSCDFTTPTVSVDWPNISLPPCPLCVFVSLLCLHYLVPGFSGRRLVQDCQYLSA